MFRRILSIGLISLALTSRADGAPSATNEITYEIQDNDTLYLIATQYYGNPAAFKLLFKRNEGTLREAHGKHAKEAALRGEKVSAFGTGTLWPRTTIMLPQELSTSAGVLFERRSVPLARHLADKIAKNPVFKLDDLKQIGDAVRPPGIKPAEQVTALEGFAQVSENSSPVTRETPPTWHEYPANALHKCGVSICAKFKSLCYAECLAVAKRFVDGGALCSPLPAVLPYDEVQSSTKNCSALME